MTLADITTKCRVIIVDPETDRKLKLVIYDPELKTPKGFYVFGHYYSDGLHGIYHTTEVKVVEVLEDISTPPVKTRGFADARLFRISTT